MSSSSYLGTFAVLQPLFLLFQLGFIVQFLFPLVYTSLSDSPTAVKSEFSFSVVDSSSCICWRNRIRVGFLFRPSFLLFPFIFSILCNSCPLFGHFILPNMARDHAEN